MKSKVNDRHSPIKVQYLIHIDKKLWTLLLSPWTKIFWRHFLAHKNYSQLVIELFTRDEYDLLDKDINVKDK